MSAERANGHAAGAAAASENRSSVMAQMTVFEQLFGGGVSASQVIIEHCLVSSTTGDCRAPGRGTQVQHHNYGTCTCSSK